jgi:putative membrane-bound dehydrogenase-like protein
MRLKHLLVIVPFLVCACNDKGSKKPTARGLSPEEAMATFELAEGFQIEQIAAEPLVADPVDMEVDESGRLFVVEMHGYPLDKDGSGAVKMLEDTDGDGIMDKYTVFADKLVLPTGIMRWKKGFLVTDPPNVLYLEDTDGDGKADKREVILTGFALANPQHNVNNPLLGIDNWVYLGHEPAATAKVYTDYFSDRGSEVHFPTHPDAPKLPENALGRSVRFHPDKLLLENLSSQTQFGHTFDRWGHRFMVSNAHHIYHEVIAAKYLNRNKNMLVSNTIESVSDHGNAADVYAITKNPEHQLLTDLGVFTAACGITAYGGGLFPTMYDSVTFVAEPVGNLIHADILRDRGATFTASRVFEKKEFLASTDSWFRPVNMYVGPDGALYVLDYYRQIIEHPEWMADDVAKSGAIYNGVDQGRIYRITPKGSAKIDWSGKLKLGEASTTELIGYLESPNAWWRTNAQRLLIDRKDAAAISALEKVAVDSKSALGRLHALWTLHGLDALTAATLTQAFSDPEAGVRENAIRMSEDKFLALDNEDSRKVTAALIRLQTDKSSKVKFQLLATLGSIDTPEAIQVRKNLLFSNLNDHWMQIAALSAKPSSSENLMEEVIRRYQSGNAQYASLVERLSQQVAASLDIDQVASLIGRALSSGNAEWKEAILKGLAQGLRNKKIDKDKLSEKRSDLLQATLTAKDKGLRRASADLIRVLGLPEGESTLNAVQASVKKASDKNLDPEQRSEAIRILTLDDVSKHKQLLEQLINTNEPVPIQSAALSALSSIRDSTVSIFLVNHWKTLTPGLREQAIGTFMGSEARVKLLLDALEKNIIDPSAISWPRQVGLMAQGNEALRLKARSLLAHNNESRTQVIKEYADALTLTGNADKGKEVFAQQCAICHQIGGKNGVFYGPDLATIRTRRPESILADILDPNLSIADGYDVWNVELKSGETLQGLIATETPTAITLRNYGGLETVVARADVKQLTSMGTSVMTAGFDRLIDKQQMADLIAYLKQPQ